MQDYRIMTDEERMRCKAWIDKYLSEYPRKTADSYVLKHLCEKMTGVYSTEAEFQEIMAECGFIAAENSASTFSVKIDSIVIKHVYK